MFEPIPIALLMAVISCIAARKATGGKTGLTVLTALWLSYSVYEYLMYKRVLCSGDCNIRVDLLLFYPLLIGSTVWLFASARLKSLRKGSNAS